MELVVHEGIDPSLAFISLAVNCKYGIRCAQSVYPTMKLLSMTLK